MSERFRRRAVRLLTPVGPTPLRRCPVPVDRRISLHVKDETVHPTGSVKHRFARDLVLDAVRAGRITEGTPLVEATGGNTAVAEAHFARLLGLPFTAVVPRKTARARLARIEEQGGRWHPAGPPIAIYDQARVLAEVTGAHYLDHLHALADSVDARVPDTPLAAEILADLPEPPAWIVLGVGTGASSRAVGRFVRHHGLPTRIAVVDPENSAYFPGWVTDRADYATGMPSAIDGIGRPRVEPAFDPAVVDLVIPVPDAAAVAAMRHFAATTGVHAGPSTGAALWGALHLVDRMRQEGARGPVVLIAADSARAHVDTYYDNRWTTAKGWDLATPAATLDHFRRTGEWRDR
ncbi:pyridoxal-phosphate dependent enzyme [Actinosynnema sp. NPDC020468]|uniref:PLP-dependent cysteine synthase family protein n=1 Tax=Actinosynnema sp. NPDC020468 TaxID=3154488 RepID=UPI0034017383